MIPHSRHSGSTQLRTQWNACKSLIFSLENIDPDIKSTLSEILFPLISVDYILKDPEEKTRLHITAIPRAFPQRIIRAPVPWHDTYQQMKEFNEMHLFTTNPMMLELQNIWFNE